MFGEGGDTRVMAHSTSLVSSSQGRRATASSQAPDQAKPGRIVLLVGAIAGAIAGGYLVRLLMTD